MILKRKTRDSEGLLDVLFAEGAVGQGDINKINEKSKTALKTAAEIILEEGKISEETLAEAVSKSSGIPKINLARENPSQEAIDFIRKDEAVKNLIIPFYLDEKTLKIAAADPEIIEKKDPETWQRIRKASQRKIDLYIATFSEIKFALKSYGLENQKTKMIKVDSKRAETNSAAKEKEILDILVRQDLISSEQAKSIKTKGKRLKIDDYLLEKRIVNPDELAKAYSSIYHYPVIKLADLKISFEVINKFPEEISKKYRVVAFEMVGERIVKVALSRPFDPQVDELLNYVADKNELEVDRYITTDEEIEEALKSYQQSATSSQPTAASQKQEAGSRKPEADLPTADTDIGRLLKEDVKSVTALEDIIKKGSVPLMVAAIVNFAIFRRASDVHLQPGEKNVRLRYRIDGVLNDIATIPLEMLPALVSRVKILSKLRIDEKRIPQDGRFEVIFNKKSVDIRVSTLPTTHGEKLVMRLLDTSRGTFSLDELGLRQESFKKFIASITKPFGMIIACGPTGSGKTTTLYAALNYINKPGVNIVTLEDPVEYEIEGLSQAQAKPEIGFDFADGLRSVLRQDPDIIMVGEIRDKETAGMAVQSSLTGHLVFSSLHTNDSSGGIPRLINMGIEPFLIISAVNIFIAQRLVRKICPNCKEEAKLPPTLWEKIKKEIDLLPPKSRARLKKPYKFYQGRGCRSCSEGYYGRIGIFEVLPMTEKIQKMTMVSPTAVMIKQTAVEEGMLTMKQDGLIKALEGITTVEEVLRVTIS